MNKEPNTTHISPINAVIGMRIFNSIESGNKAPHKIKVSYQEWKELNYGTLWQTDMDCNIKWNDYVVVLRPEYG